MLPHTEVFLFYIKILFMILTDFDATILHSEAEEK